MHIKRKFVAALCLVTTSVIALATPATYPVTPNGFTENLGQIVSPDGEPAEEVLFLLEGDGLNVQLRTNGFSYDAWQDNEHGERSYHRIDVVFKNAIEPTIERQAQQSGVTHWYNRTEPVTNVRSYGKVTYNDIYPGVDVEFIALGSDPQGGMLFEYNFVVSNSEDLDQIALEYAGHHGLSAEANTITLQTAFGAVKESIPAAWCSTDLLSVGIGAVANDAVVQYHANEICWAGNLVVDPIVTTEWSTYYGVDGSTVFHGVEVNETGNLVAAGHTSSQSGIATTGNHQMWLTGTPGEITGGNPPTSVFLAQFTPEGERLWATYYGGERLDYFRGLALHNDRVIVVGSTTSGSNIAFGNAHLDEYEETTAFNEYGFIGVFNDDGLINWSTYVNASGVQEHSTFIHEVVFFEDEVCICGSTAFYEGVSPGNPGVLMSSDNFVSCYNAEGDQLWMNLISGSEFEGSSILSVWEDQLVMLGYTPSDDIASSNATLADALFERTMFLAFIDADGEIDEITYLPLGAEAMFHTFVLRARLVSPDGTWFVAGNTNLDGFGVGNVHQTEYPGGTESCFLLSIDLPSRSVNWGTYYGTGSTDFLGDMDFDASGSLWLAGFTGSQSGLATDDAQQQTAEGASQSTFIARFSNEGMLEFGTYLGNGLRFTTHAMCYHENELYLGGSAAVDGLGTPGAHQENTTGFAFFSGVLMKLNLTTLVEEQLSIGVSLFPNPAADALNVEWSLQGSSHFNPHLWRLYDLTGRMAASGTWPSSAQRAQINVSSLPPGAYLLQLLDAGGQTTSSRFVKR